MYNRKISLSKYYNKENQMSEATKTKIKTRIVTDSMGEIEVVGYAH